MEFGLNKIYKLIKICIIIISVEESIVNAPRITDPEPNPESTLESTRSRPGLNLVVDPESTWGRPGVRTPESTRSQSGVARSRPGANPKIDPESTRSPPEPTPKSTRGQPKVVRK
jgi:hypothetical protein